MKNQLFSTNRILRKVLGGFAISALALTGVFAGSGAAVAASCGDGANSLLSVNGNCYSASESGTSFNVSRASSSNTVPEPETWAMFGAGAVMIGGGLALRRRRKDADGV